MRIIPLGYILRCGIAGLKVMNICVVLEGERSPGFASGLQTAGTAAWRAVVGDPLEVTESSVGGWSVVRCGPPEGRGPPVRGSSSGLPAPPAPPRAGGGSRAGPAG